MIISYSHSISKFRLSFSIDIRKPESHFFLLQRIEFFGENRMHNFILLILNSMIPINFLLPLLLAFFLLPEIFTAPARPFVLILFLLFHEILEFDVTETGITISLWDLDRKLFDIGFEVEDPLWRSTFGGNQAALRLVSWIMFHNFLMILVLFEPEHFSFDTRISSFQKILFKAMWLISTAL